MHEPGTTRLSPRLYVVTGGMALLVVAVLAVSARVLLPFELGFLFAYVINPVISAIARQRVGRFPVPRWAAVLLVYGVVGFLLWTFAISVLPQVYQEVVRGLTELRDRLAELQPDTARIWAEKFQAFVDRYGVPIEFVPGGVPGRPHLTVDLAAVLGDLLADAGHWARGQLGDVLGLSRALLGGAIRTIFFVVLLVMLTAFVSMDAPRILRYVESVVPSVWRADWLRLLTIIDQHLAGVVRGQLTVCLLNGTLTFIGLLVLRIPFPFALAALATVLYLLPIFGTIISTAPVVLLALAAGGVSKAALSLGMILAIHALEAYVLNPKIMGDASRIHPVLIVLALVVGEHWFGLVGALLAVPAASLVASVFKFMHLKAMEIEARLAPPPPAPPVAGP